MSVASRAGAVLVFVTLPLGWGCGQKTTEFNTDFDQNELVDFYEAYTEFSKQNQRPPRSLSDMKKLEEVHPLGVRVVREGKIVAVWGVSSTDAKTVLAYQKATPTEGGAVVMADGSVVRMSAAEFQAVKPKAS